MYTDPDFVDRSRPLAKYRVLNMTHHMPRDKDCQIPNPLVKLDRMNMRTIFGVIFQHQVLWLIVHTLLLSFVCLWINLNFKFACRPLHFARFNTFGAILDRKHPAVQSLQLPRVIVLDCGVESCAPTAETCGHLFACACSCRRTALADATRPLYHGSSDPPPSA